MRAWSAGSVSDRALASWNTSNISAEVRSPAGVERTQEMRPVEAGSFRQRARRSTECSLALHGRDAVFLRVADRGSL